MQILIVKTSSFGDIIHAVPALVDAHQNIPNCRVDWLIDDQFLHVINEHPLVNQAIPCHWRRFKGNLLAYRRSSEWLELKRQLRLKQYDAVVDLQGLLKSALLTKLCRPHASHGYDWHSCKESPASLLYRTRHKISRCQNAISRNRQLMASALNYQLPTSVPQYNWQDQARHSTNAHILLFTNTSWSTKYWPKTHWIELGRQLVAMGFVPTLVWGSPSEQQFVQTLNHAIPGSHLLGKTSMGELQRLIASANGFVGVDTGLTHLATAMDCPGICLMGATDPNLTGPLGQFTRTTFSNLDCSPCKSRRCTHREFSPNISPCMQRIAPNQVIGQLIAMIQLKTQAQIKMP